MIWFLVFQRKSTTTEKTRILWNEWVSLVKPAPIAALIQNDPVSDHNGPVISVNECPSPPLWLNWLRICPQCRRPQFDSWVGKIHWRRDRLPIPVFLGFPCSSAGKESICNVGDLGSVPGLGRFPGEGKGYPFQYSGLENSMGCIVHGVTKSRTPLSDFHYTT